MEDGILSPGRGPRRQGGFTLVEVLFSIVLLGIAMMSAQAFMTERLVVEMGGRDRDAVATQLAQDRIQAIQLDPVYGSLSSRYAGTETSIAGFPHFQRVTAFQHVATVVPSHGVIDYQRVTVTVTHPNLKTPVSITETVGAP
jgi:prepilin-type N-terminal cleavage/methylation domain-containing protein